MSLLLNLTSCVYCGHSATSRDHFIPLEHEISRYENFEVPCCTPYNSSASDKLFPTFEEKATWLLNKALQTNRVRIQILQLTAPLVIEALHLREAGKSSAPQNVAPKTSSCATCGTILSLRSIQRGRKYCGAICANRMGKDNSRRRNRA